MFLLIDNYDSFTYNLYHFLGELGARIEVRRNDQLSADEALAMHPQGIVISPGPCDPDRAGICLELVEKGAGNMPMLGVCLGHQAIGQAFGGRVVRAELPMHGKTSSVHHRGTGVFADLPSPITATRYHSLTLDREDWPDCLDITAETDDGVSFQTTESFAIDDNVPTIGRATRCEPACPPGVRVAGGRRSLPGCAPVRDPL